MNNIKNKKLIYLLLVFVVLVSQLYYMLKFYREASSNIYVFWSGLSFLIIFVFMYLSIDFSKIIIPISNSDFSKINSSDLIKFILKVGISTAFLCFILAFAIYKFTGSEFTIDNINLVISVASISVGTGILTAGFLQTYQKYEKYS